MTPMTTEQLLGQLAKQDEAKLAEKLAEREIEALMMRKRSALLRMAGNIASGLCADVSGHTDADEIASQAVNIATKIYTLVEHVTAVRPKP